MSVYRRQALINAPPRRIWELVGDPRRHPEWWPRVIEVRGERFEEGADYAQVTRDLGGGEVETTMSLESLDDLHQIHVRCQSTGTYARWVLTEARGDTFVDVEFGMDPKRTAYRIFDATLGRLYFRRWLSQSLAALESVATEADLAAQPGTERESAA